MILLCAIPAYLLSAQLHVFITFLLFFFLSVILIYYIVKRFIHEKIKVIYKNIYKFKGTSRLKHLDIDNAEQEAEDWADAQQKELQQLKTDGNF